MNKAQNITQSTDPAISFDTVLDTRLAIEIIEATGRFQYVGEQANVFEFWDKEFEIIRHIQKNFTIKDTFHRLSIEIMESTGLFEYVGEQGNLFEFWDKKFEIIRHIQKNFTLKDTVQYLVGYFHHVYDYQGEEKAKHQIRDALDF